jgi:hypothetical protein
MGNPTQLLQSSLDEYRRREKELSEYQSKAEKSQREAQLAISNDEINEGAAANKLAHAQVLSARVKARELELNRSINEFGKTTARASHELNDAVRDAWGKRQDIIGLRGCQAMGIDPKCLELGELDTVLTLSEPLNAIRAFEVGIYHAQYIEKATQKPQAFITTNIGDREVLEPLTTDREPKLTQELDIEYLIGSAEKILENFEKLADEMKREI